LQSIDVIRLDRQDSRTQPLRIGKAPLLTQPLSLRERARHIQPSGVWFHDVL
jgi:hypothetical protein